MISHLFLDLDDVLADFVTPALAAHGMTYNEQQYPAGEWHLEKVLNISVHRFWMEIDKKDPTFWPDLLPLPWMNELLALAKTFPRWSIITAPSEHHSSYSGKRRWVTKHLPHLPSKDLLLCADKALLAQPDRLLIDDKDDNVQAWQEAGGQAILFPRRWNKLHSLASMPMLHVGMELGRLGMTMETAAA